MFENDKIILVQPRQPPFASVPGVVFTDGLLVVLKRAGLLVMRWGFRLGDGQSYCRSPLVMLLVETAWLCHFSDVFQQNLALKCIFYCLTVI